MVREKRFFFQGQGKVRKFWIKSGKFLISATVSVYMEEGGWMGIIYVGRLIHCLKQQHTYSKFQYVNNHGWESCY